MPGLLYADDLVLCSDLEKDLKEMAGWSAEVYRRGLKVNASKSKVMVLNGVKGFEYEVHVDGIRLEHALKFKYLGCVLDESGTDGVECNRMVASRRRVSGAIRSLVNARVLQLECARVLHQTLLMHVLTYYGKRRKDVE